MFNWKFDSESWTDEEKNNIEKITESAEELFGYENFTRVEIEKDIYHKYETEYGTNNLNIVENLLTKLMCLLESSEIEHNKRVIEDIQRFIEKKEETVKLIEIFNYLIECGDDKIKKACDEIKKYLPVKEAILGKYNHKENKIVIYMQAIRDASNVDRNVLVEEVLVHELFHAMHYNTSKPNIKKTWNKKGRDSYKKTVVKESMADYFAYFYLYNRCKCEYDKYECAYEKLKDKWNKYSITNYPYSGAKAFLIDEKGELFNKVKRACELNGEGGWRVPYSIIEKCCSVVEELEQISNGHLYDYL